jgi:uncharacterized protein DUF6088
VCQKLCYISDRLMEPLSTRILGEAAEMPEGAPLYAKALLHLGSRAAIDQTLSRLARRGRLLRAGRGLYVRPVETRFGTRTPSVPAVLEALTATTGEMIAAHGAAAANSLGLTTQVPVRTVYLTSGPSRRLNFGAQTVELQHAPRWQLSLPGRPAGDAIRALAWLGKGQSRGITRKLGKALSAETLKELSGARGRVPTWMAQQISTLVEHA